MILLNAEKRSSFALACFRPNQALALKLHSRLVEAGTDIIIEGEVGDLALMYVIYVKLIFIFGFEHV